MNNLNNNYWLCFKTNFREEFLAKHFLVSKGFKVFLPYYLKTVNHARKKFQLKYPIFPSYGFIQYDYNLSSLNKIKYARGVKYYLKNSEGYPKLISKNVIEAIEVFRKEDGSYRVNPNIFKSGDNVKILDGVFAGMKAIFKEQVDELRSCLLINLLGRINEIRIDLQEIKKA